jgi:plasmid stabilization system protein ParE
MKIRLLNVAIEEIDEAYEYYEDQMPGLGNEFLSEILDAFKKIKSQPKIWTPFSRRTRRFLAKKFPYGIIYQIKEKHDEILIIAIAHLHRKPGYWNDRIGN